jgi:hypothetical protein
MKGWQTITNGFFLSRAKKNARWFFGLSRKDGHPMRLTAGGQKLPGQVFQNSLKHLLDTVADGAVDFDYWIKGKYFAHGEGFALLEKFRFNKLRPVFCLQGVGPFR